MRSSLREKDSKTFFLTLLISVFCFSCAQNKNASPENIKTDSAIHYLKERSFNNPDSVITVINNFLPQLNENENKAKFLLLIASIYELKGNFDLSIKYAKKGLEITKEEKLKASLYNEIGVSYDYKSDYNNALTNYHLAQEYFEKVSDTIGYIKVQNNIGLIYQNTGELTRAKKYFEEGLRLSKEKHYKEQEVMSLSNIASAENELHNFEKALGYFKEVLQMDMASGNETYISYSLHNVGEAYKNLRQFDSAGYYFTKAIELKEKLGLKPALVNSYKGYADLLTEMNKLAEAKQYLNKAFLLARETGTTDYLQDCFYLQSVLAEKNGDFKTAYTSLDSFHTIKDSLSNAKFRTELIIKETDHELESNERIRKQQEDEFESEKVTFVLFIIFLLAVSTSLLFLLRKQRRLNKQLHIQKQQIEEGLSQRSQLLSFLAHEIRNPLGGILGLTDLLLTDAPTASQKELLEYQKKASVHLLSLMNDVLDYQKLGSGKVELNSIRFNLRDVLYQVYALYQGEIREKKLSYDLDYDEKIPAVLLGDPIRLTQVFSNLLNNAIKFTEKGTITISAHIVHRTNSEIAIFCKVTDSGVGIPAEDQEKIFELYVQSSKNKSEQLGTGLGLSIVKNLLSLMHSQVQLNSEQGKGTTFSFTINFKIPQ